MKLRLKAKKKYPWSGKKPWEKGSNPSGNKASPRRLEDTPLHLNPRTWKPKDGKDGVAKDQDLQSLKKMGVNVQHEVMRCFRDGHLNTGDFQRWVRANKSNTMAFYSWVLKDLMPKSVQLSVMGGDGDSPNELPLVVKIEQRKERAK